MNKFISQKYEYLTNVWYFWVVRGHTLRNARYLAKHTL